MEIWKPVKEYEGIYEVSSLGNVRTCSNKTTYTERHGLRTWKQRVLKQKTDKEKRKRVTLWKDGTRKDFLVHRLVAEVFCDKVEGKDIINHIDGNPSNNDYTNLEWCNHYENLMHAYSHELNKTPIKVSLIDKVTKEKHDFYSMSEASRFLNCNNGYLSLVLKRGQNEAKGFSIVVPF